jgi:hypothetical protein
MPTIDRAEWRRVAGALDELYRVELGRGPAETAVDLEGWAVWLPEYGRWRASGLGEGDAWGRVRRQVLEAAGLAPAAPTAGRLAVRAAARLWRGNLWHGFPRAWMFPAYPVAEQERLIGAYAAAGFTHLAFAPYGRYGDLACDYRADLEAFGAVLDRCLAAGVQPCVFLITDEADGRLIDEARLSDQTRRIAGWLAGWARARGAGVEDRVALACLGWEIEQVQPWLHSGLAQLRMLATIRAELSREVALLYWHPGPHRSVPEDEITLGAWPARWPGEEDRDGHAWLHAARTVGLDGVLLNTGSPQAMTTARLFELLDRGDPPTFERYRWWGPDPGYLGRYRSVGLDAVLFEHGYQNRPQWEQQAAWAAAHDPRLLQGHG